MKNKMAVDTATEVVCPNVELLTKIETNLPCPQIGCAKLFPNSSSLRMHLVKTHNVVSNPNENEMFDRGSSFQNKSSIKKKTLYCCPVDSCVRGRSGNRPFSRLAHVKQHYMTVHGEKKFSCKICGKKFGRNDACIRHEKACGKVFPCSCGCPFNSRTSMLTHAKRNGHTVPDSGTSKMAGSNEVRTVVSGMCLSDPEQSQPLCMMVFPIVSKSFQGFRPLRPKKLFSDSETQTEQLCISNSDGRSLVPNEKSVTVDIPGDKPQLEVSCEYNETIGEVHTQTNFISDEQHFDVDFAIENTSESNEEFKELTNSQTQTSCGLEFDSFPIFEDNETQTLESFLEFDTSSITIDCATQTKNILDDIFSVDTETQTLFPMINFVEEQLESIPCHSEINNQPQAL